MKSNKGALKRFKVTATGRIKRARGFKSHLLSSKGKKRKRRLRRGAMVSVTEQKSIRKLIPYL
jgi:large subunit ribosomal protein L35